jgi:AAA15 family ATPase/GTPase
MLKSLMIRNLRGIKECTINGLAEVNILIGRNGAGKSTILEALYLASAWANPNDIIRNFKKADYVVRRRGDRGDWKSYRDILWFIKFFDEDIEINLRFSNNKELKFRIPYELPFISLSVSDSTSWLDISSEVITEKSMFENYKYFNLATGYVLDPITKMCDKRSEIIHKVSSMFKDEIEFLQNVIFIDDRILPKDIQLTVWSKLLNRRLDRLVVEVIKEEFESDAEDLTYKPVAENKFVLALKLLKSTIEVDGLGDGAVAAILMASIISIAQKSVVLIEDPEVHQHPGGLATVMRFALKIAKERGLQLIMTTHSIELINIVRKLCEELEFSLKVYFVERDRDGVVHVKDMESVDVDVLQKIGLDPRLLHVL